MLLTLCLQVLKCVQFIFGFSVPSSQRFPSESITGTLVLPWEKGCHIPLSILLDKPNNTHKLNTYLSCAAYFDILDSFYFLGISSTHTVALCVVGAWFPVLPGEATAREVWNVSFTQTWMWDLDPDPDLNVSAVLHHHTQQPWAWPVSWQSNILKATTSCCCTWQISW